MQSFLSVPRRQQLLVAAAVLAPQAALARVPWQVRLVLRWSFMAYALSVCVSVCADAASKRFRHIKNHGILQYVFRNFRWRLALLWTVLKIVKTTTPLGP